MLPNAKSIHAATNQWPQPEPIKIYFVLREGAVDLKCLISCTHTALYYIKVSILQCSTVPWNITINHLKKYEECVIWHTFIDFKIVSVFMLCTKCGTFSPHSVLALMTKVRSVWQLMQTWSFSSTWTSSGQLWL